MSTRRDLVYKMTADPEGFKKGMREAGEDSNQFYRELRKLEKQQQAVDSVMTGAGIALLGFGVAAGAGLVMASRAAIEWESAWAGVAKVVEGSPEQLGALEEELRGLATTLPQTHTEIAGVAAAAGQLGVATEDIAGFTETMVNLGVATNLTAEDASFALARMMNIMQTAPEDVNRLGSAIVDLGNNSATTEADIVAMALRISGAGQQIGLSEADVLAYSAALSSVGVEAEAGGTAISLAFKRIDGAVREGGDTLEAFAEVAGVSGEEFRSAYQDDAAGAIQTFVAGLGRMNAEGGDVFGTLADLGMTGERLQDSLLRLSGAGDLLNDTLETSSTAWDENTALMEEAARRYQTTEAQIQIARNQLVDIGITLGETLLPILNQFLDVASGMMSFFSDLPAPVQTSVVVLGAAATAIGLVGGAALIAVPKVHEFRRTLLEIGTPAARGINTALGGVASFLMGPWGIALGAAAVGLGMFASRQAESRARVDELSKTLDDQTGAITDNTRAWVANELQGKDAFDAAQRLGISQSELVDAVLEGNDEIVLQNAAMQDLVASHEEGTIVFRNEKGELVELASHFGGLSDSEMDLIDDSESLRQQIETLNGEYVDAKDVSDNMRAALEAEGEATSQASAETQILAQNLGLTTDAAASAADGFDKLDEKVRALIDSAFALSGAERDVEAGIDAVTESLEENGSTLDRTTEKGRDNEAAVEALVTDMANLAIATAEETGSAEEANEVLDTQRDRLRDVLEQAGLTEGQINDYIGVLDRIPSEIETIVDAHINISTTETINRRIVEQVGTRAPQINEKGGVYVPAQEGLLREAGVFSTVFPARYAFAEPQTGGEAFVPRIGDRSRSLGILQEAAAWHRASVVPNEAGGQAVNVNVTAYSNDFSLSQVLDDLTLRGLV